MSPGQFSISGLVFVFKRFFLLLDFVENKEKNRGVIIILSICSKYFLPI